MVDAAVDARVVCVVVVVFAPLAGGALASSRQQDWERQP